MGHRNRRADEDSSSIVSRNGTGDRSKGFSQYSKGSSSGTGSASRDRSQTAKLSSSNWVGTAAEGGLQNASLRSATGTDLGSFSGSNLFSEYSENSSVRQSQMRKSTSSNFREGTVDEHPSSISSRYSFATNSRSFSNRQSQLLELAAEGGGGLPNASLRSTAGIDFTSSSSYSSLSKNSLGGFSACQSQMTKSTSSNFGGKTVGEDLSSIRMLSSAGHSRSLDQSSAETLNNLRRLGTQQSLRLELTSPNLGDRACFMGGYCGIFDRFRTQNLSNSHILRNLSIHQSQLPKLPSSNSGETTISVVEPQCKCPGAVCRACLIKIQAHVIIVLLGVNDKNVLMDAFARAAVPAGFYAAVPQNRWCWCGCWCNVCNYVNWWMAHGWGELWNPER